MSKRNAKKKKSISEMMAAHGIGVYKEARSSVALDGDTQCCMACVRESVDRVMDDPAPKHTCGQRPMTAAESELVEAALLFVTRHTGGRGCEIRLDLSDCGSSEEIVRKAEAVRAERKEAAK